MAHVDYALVKDGKVVNVVVIDDTDALTLARFAGEYEAVVPLVAGQHGVAVTQRSGRIGGPGVGWTYNAAAKRFTAPPPPPEIPPDAPTP